MLDMKTAIVIYAAICIACAATMAVVWYQARKHYNGLALALAYLALEAIGAILIILRGNIPDFVSIVVANILIMGGVWFLLLALERFAGLKSSQVFNGILLMIFAFLHFYFGIIQPDLAYRNINTNLAGLIFAAQCIWLLLYRVKPEIHRIASGITVAVAVFALVLITRIVVQFVFPLPSNNFFESGTYDVTMIVLLIVAIMGITFNLVAMVNRRLFDEVQLYLGEKEDAAHKLLESENKYRQLSESSLTGIFILQDDRYVYVNERFAQLHGYAVPELIGMEYWKLDHPDERGLAAQTIKDRIEGKIIVPVQRRRIRKDGTQSQVDIIGTAIVYHGRQAILGNVIDVTDRREMEEALSQSEQKFRSIAEQLADMVFITDDKGVITYVSIASMKMFGYTPDEMRGRRFAEFLSEADIPKAVAQFSATLAGGVPAKNLSLQMKRQDGSSFAGELSSSTYHQPGGSGTIGTIRDVTLRRKAEESLRLQAEMLDRAADWVEVNDFEGNLIYVNQAICIAHGYTREEMLSMNLQQLDSLRSVNLINQRRKQMRERGQITYVTDHIRKDGSLISVEVTATLVKWQDREVVLNTARDISERKHLDEERQRTAKLQSVGTLAGGIAHDFNNILTAILGNISIATMETKPGEEIHNRLIEAEKASLRAKDLTQQLLTFARGGAPVKKQAHLGQMIKETASFALRGSNSSCQFSIPQDLWQAEVDLGQISQVINNLVINARQAMPTGGTIELRADNITLTEELRLGRSLPLEPGNYIRIAVTDHGIGISPQYLDKIFDPYFTTKQTGSGLGLATSYSIIRNHGGHISVESKVNKGSTFYIYIPAAVGKTGDTAAETPEELPVGSGRILVMDDEATVRDVAQRMLNRLGYCDVVAAAHGEEAIAIYKEAMEAGKPFSAVILDLTIPGGMGGKETIAKLREIDPKTKAIVSSGYAGEAVMSEFQRYGFNGIVTKPYTVEQLGRAVREVIKGNSAKS